MAKEKISEIYNNADGNDDMLSDIGNVGMETRQGMWTFMPDKVGDNSAPQSEMLPEDGSAKFSTDNSIGQDDEPVHNNIDTSPSIENDLNANLNMREDLEYRHVNGDATDDQYELDERQLSSMAGSSTVEVKQKCRLAGNGNTSTACNQGDIRNLNIKPLHESASLNIPENLSGYDSLKIMNGDQVVGEVGIMDRGVHGGNHYIAIDKIFINKEFRGNDYANDAMKLIFDYADKNNLIVTLTPDNIWGASVPKLKAWYKSLGFIENKGKKKDFQTMQLMYRLPKTPTNLSEDVDPKTINTNRKAIYSVITGKRKLAFGEVDKPLGQAIEKRGFGLIPVRMTSRHAMMSIVYNKDSYENARKLYEIAKTHGDYLTDNTASEAREIGRLLEYKEASIAEYIKQKYGDRALSTHEKSPEDFDDLSEDMDFWDLNDLNEEDFPAFEKQIEKDEITHGLDKKILYEQDDFKVCAVNGDAVRGNGFDEWVDGGHYYVDADLPKDEQKYAKYIPEDEIWIDDVFLAKPNDMAAIILHEKLERYLMKNYGIEYENAHTDYANKAEVVFRKLVKDGTGSLISQKIFDAFVNKFIQDHPDKKKVHEGVADVAADKQFGIEQPHAGFEDRFNREESEEDVVYSDPSHDMTIIRNPKSLNSIWGNVRGIIDPDGNLYIQQKPVDIHYEMLRILNDLHLIDNEADWDEKLPTSFLTVQRYLRTNKIFLGESNAPMFPQARDTQSTFWSKIPPREESAPYYQAFLDKAKRKNPSIEFVNELIHIYTREHENDETFNSEYLNEELSPENIKTAIEKLKLPVKISEDKYAFSVKLDEFIHFTPMEKAEKILAENKLSSGNGEYAVWAISIKYGMYLASVQTTHIKEKNLVAIKFSTTVPPKIGYTEEVVWNVDVPLINAEIMEVDAAISLLDSSDSNYQKQLKENLRNFSNHYVLYVENANFAKNDSMNLNENEIMSLDDLPFKQDVERQGGKIYSVGGAVRDKFLGKESKDLDVIVTGIPLDKLERIISRYGVVNAVGKSYGVLKFKPRGAPEDSEDIDIVIPRTDTPTGGGGYQDFDIESDHTIPLEKDLERRDFTINAMARDRNGEIIDPYGGQEDLKNKIIRAVNPKAFNDDPLRMLRAVQFACRFGFTIEPYTMKMIKDNVKEIKRISAERYLIEFDKIIKKGNIVMGVELLMETGLFSQIFNAQPKNVTPLFAKVKTMAEFLYLLMIGSVKNPAEFYLEHFASDEDAKRSKNYKEIRALETGFESGEATNLIEARSIAHNMYLIFPQALESQILPNVIRVAAQELLQGEYPKTVNELAVNGNDLVQAGLKGKAIGDMQKTLLLKIYADKLKNDKDDLLNFINKNNTGMLKEEKKSERIEYGCFMLFLDVPIWSKITSVIDKNDLYIKGDDYGIEKEPHLTLLYGFHDEVTPEEVFDLYKSNFELKPLDVKIKGISIFENPEFDVVKFDVNPEGLTEINTVMKELPNTNTFPEYHPHITIAYVKKGEGHKYIRPFEKERKLKGNELVYTWKGHRGNDGEKLMLDDSINELAYSEMNSEQSTWTVNGQQVGLPFFVEKYDVWNQGAYTDPSDFTVVQFLHQNFKELAGDEKLKKELLWALTDRNILDESVINEASIDTMNYESIVTPEYIKQIEMSDNFEMFLDYYRYEHDLVGTEDEEIEDTDEFKNWFKYELMNKYDDAVDRISRKIKPDGTIDIWRRMTVDDEENRWVNHLADAGKHLGIYWSWEERAAEAHWGNAAHSNSALIKSSVNEKYVDWRNTLYANMDISLGEDEKEITLFKNTSLKIQELLIDDVDAITSELAMKTFYA